MTSTCVSLDPFALRMLDDSMVPDLPAAVPPSDEVGRAVADRGASCR